MVETCTQHTYIAHAWLTNVSVPDSVPGAVGPRRTAYISNMPVRGMCTVTIQWRRNYKRRRHGYGRCGMRVRWHRQYVHGGCEDGHCSVVVVVSWYRQVHVFYMLTVQKEQMQNLCEIWRNLGKAVWSGK